MNEDTALSISTVYTAVGIIADAVSTLPLVTYQASNTGKGIVPSPPLVEQPWPECSRQDFIAMVITSLCLRGNFFGLITDRDGQGYPTMIKPFHPDHVSARRDKAGQRQYWFDGTHVSTDDVVHLVNRLMPGSFIGLDPISYARPSWALSHAATIYGGQYFANNANPSGFLSVGEDLTEEETLEFARAWKAAHSGLGNAGLPAVLTGGAEWHTISVAQNEMQYIELRTFQQQEIAAFFRIPPHMLGQVDRSPQAVGNEEVEMAFVNQTLMNYIVRVEDMFTKYTPPRYITKFDLNQRLRGNQTARYANYAVGINTGYLLIDEARAREDMDPLPNGWGQVPWRPLNFASIKNAIAGTTQPPGIGEVPTGQGGQGGGIDQNPNGGGGAPAPSNIPSAPVDGSP